MLAGHIDSWDVGQGAMDDAAGAILGWQVSSFTDWQHSYLKI